MEVLKVDALKLLVADHNRVRGLFSLFEKAKTNNDRTSLAHLSDRIIEELTVHTAIEEEIFYPEVRALSQDTGEDVAEGLQEHHVVKMLIAEIQALEPGSEAWVAKMTVLIESVEHHAGEEEEELFPEVRRRTDTAARHQLGVRLEGRKVELGAPVVADKIDLTSQELRRLAQQQEIPGRSTMDKEELAATVAPS